ncbi:hypothetical protein PLESTB_001679200 [Pleodorina starrii]|uniref:Uncharacterized protein n=1 Tax=Pleodorina starrii TaxID=330485 RepID=A0A9W6C0D4_9CHLO|nr:hypothetical protein PLESTM_001058000 [Pleodorina starrii]GLC60816.1 hypothetical protein PLESTB_001679200 [Pleodorina starrii]GLC66736.1 hypothetical protein PLESTF_000466700 [Pleodorina starrii]
MAKECIHCMFIIPPEKARSEALVLHVMETCKGISKADRDAFIQARAAEVAGKRKRAEAFPAEAATASDLSEAGSGVAGSRGAKPGTKAGAKSQQQTSIRQFADAGLSPAMQAELDRKLGLAFFMNNIPFSVVDDPYFLDFCHSMRPKYLPEGAEIQQLVQDNVGVREGGTAAVRLPRGGGEGSL